MIGSSEMKSEVHILLLQKKKSILGFLLCYYILKKYTGCFASIRARSYHTYGYLYGTDV